MYKHRSITAIIPAAGTGKRMQAVYGDVRKQFIHIHGKPVLYYTLMTFQQSEIVDEIIIVCEKDRIRYIEVEIVGRFGFSKVKKIVQGGEHRQDSVYNGFQAIDHEGIVMIHDAARPMASADILRCLVEACDRFRAAIVAVQVKDTIKTRNADLFVGKTVDRLNLWQVQTPQCFEYSLLEKAFREATKDAFYGTDESMLVERIGHPVRIIEGDYRNIKITTPDDILLAELFLKP